ncbi:MAG TPA: amino acid permease [Candidatus Acidoferrum sp.]|nr:amino acid permease [Candidatus Acidoferrum sp.]
MTGFHPTLVRTIGRWSLVALIINTMIGASIFGLPALIAARLGRLSPAGFLVAFAGIAVIAATMAEVASQFRETGGPYLYARAAFGRFLAIENGWLTWLTRIAAVSAVANLFIIYLGEFFPGVTTPFVRATVLTLLIAFLAVVNYRGVSGGNRLSNLFTITKVTLLGFFVFAGLAALAFHPEIRVQPSSTPATSSDWFEAILLMVYSYGGFEAALIASGETRDSRKDIPFALFTAIGATTLLYIAVQYLVIHTIPNAGASAAPVVDSARHFLPHWAVQIVAGGTLVSAYGYLSANMLHTPRVTFAMGERGDFPAFFGRIHPSFRTPHVSIVIFAALVLLFSIAADFRWNALLSSVARMFVYGSVAAALPVLRKKHPEAASFRLPGGIFFAALALVFTVVLITRMRRGEFVVIGATMSLAFVNWLWARRQADAYVPSMESRRDPEKSSIHIGG